MDLRQLIHSDVHLLSSWFEYLVASLRDGSIALEEATQPLTRNNALKFIAKITENGSTWPSSLATAFQSMLKKILLSELQVPHRLPASKKLSFAKTAQPTVAEEEENAPPSPTLSKRQKKRVKDKLKSMQKVPPLEKKLAATVQKSSDLPLGSVVAGKSGPIQVKPKGCKRDRQQLSSDSEAGSRRDKYGIHQRLLASGKSLEEGGDQYTHQFRMKNVPAVKQMTKARCVTQFNASVDYDGWKRGFQNTSANRFGCLATWSLSTLHKDCCVCSDVKLLISDIEGFAFRNEDMADVVWLHWQMHNVE